MLKINNLTKKFGAFTAVSKVSLEIKEGEFFVLIGPNGSGKTTIIKNILGLLRPTEGDITINEKSIQKEPILAKKEMGYIPDEPNIWSYITGKEFIYFSGALYGMSKEEVDSKIDKLLSHFKLGGIENNYFENYSRGNKQKFVILSALLHEPKLILVDELLVGLDPQSAKKAMDLLKDFTKRGGSVLMTTHTLSVAQKHASQIGILKSGELVANDTISNLRKNIKKSRGSLTDIYYHYHEK